MDRKAFVVLLISFVLLVVWYPLTNRLFPPIPEPVETNRVDGVTNFPDAPSSQAPTAERELPRTPSEAADLIEPEEVQEVQEFTVENDEAIFTFTSSGGGLSRIELKDYHAVVDCRSKANGEDRPLATLNAPAPKAALALLLNGDLQGADRGYRVRQEGRTVIAERSLPNGVHLTKRFDVGTNFMISAVLQVENRSAEAVALPRHEWVIGTSTPIGEEDERLNMGLSWHNGHDAQHIDEGWFANRTLGCFPGTPRSVYAGGQSNVVWGAVNNRFFTIIAVPQQPAPQIVGRRLDLPRSAEEMTETGATSPERFGYTASFAYPESTLKPGEKVERRFDVYAGPKEYYTLSRLGKDLDKVMRFDGFFGFFAKLLLLSMNGLHALGLTYGLCIIAVTVIIKLLFWPLTQASTRSMKRMAALQPQMKALQEKYKDDPKKMQTKLMEFMKENKVSPLGGCLPMLLQIPVFIGFYRMLQSAIELRGAEFLWACDLSQPDTVATVAGFPINLLPIFMGATMLVQSHMTPVSPGIDPMQQKIMKYMPLIFVVFLYNFSAGLTLYWTVQNLLTIAQMKLTRSSTEPAAPSPSPGKPTLPPAKAPASKKRKPGKQG